MAQLITYLTFNGNCREAMSFYRSCLGGKLYLQTVGESPMADDLPENLKDFILQGYLKNGALMLMATDMVGEEGLRRGNSTAIMIECSSEEEMKLFYDRLAAGGEPTDPIDTTHWGALFGGLTDRYGNRWLLNFDQSKNKPKS